jgi:hypothetical protein
MLFSLVSWGQVGITTAGSAYSQDFNTLASTNTSASVPIGWLFSETGSGANSTYAAGTGSDNGGNTYSFGTSGNTERCFGTLQSGSVISTIGAGFSNSTGVVLGSLVITYTGEQWRLGATGRQDRLDFQYSLNATSLSTGTWVDVNALDFLGPISTGTAGVLDGNASANRSSVSFTITGLSISSGTTFWIRWTDFNASGADDGLGIDDFSLTPQAAVTAPVISSSTSTSITTTSATLGATITSNGGQGITERGTVYGTSANPTGNVLEEGLTSVSAFTHSRTGLTPNTFYYYRGYAINSVGTGYSPDGTFTTLPLPPTGLSASSISQVAATVGWSAPTMGSAAFTYTLEIDDDVNFASINQTLSSINSANSTNSLTGLSAATTHYVRMKTVNAQGASVYSEVLNFTTQPATSPLIELSANTTSVNSYTYNAGPSSSSSVNLSGQFLNSPSTISISGLTNFEVSTDNSTFSNTGSIIVSNASLSSTPLYFRLKAGLSVANYSETAALSGAGANSISLSLSGSVTQATPVISTLPSASAINYLVALSMSALSGGVVNTPGSFAYTNPTVVPSSGGTYTANVTFTPTDAINYSSTVVSVDVTVNAITQTITFNSLPLKVVGDPTFTLGATTTSFLTITYLSSNASVATVSGNTVTIVGAGTTIITASQVGDVSYLPASAVSQILTVKEAIVKWNFENVAVSNSSVSSPTITTGSNVADLGMNTTGSTFNAVHANSSSWSTTSGNGSNKSLSVNNWSVNDYYQFNFSSIGFQNQEISFSQTGSNTGPANFKAFYSIDGVNFTELAAAYNITNDGWSGTVFKSISVRTFSLPSSCNNLTTLKIRIQCQSINPISGIFSAGGTSRIDDFLVYGDPCAAPIIITEPITSTQNGITGATVSVSASGAGLSYQWYSNTTSSNTGGTLISGATSETYTPTPASNTYYYCIVTGTCGTVTSNASGVVTGAPVSALTAGSCNSTIANNSQIVYSTWQGAGTYKYEVSGGTLSAPVTINKTWNGFQFCDITGALPGSYSVTSSFKPTNYAQFGATSTCSVILGAGVSTTEIVASQCGSTIANPNTVVNCTWKGAGTYRFEVSGGSLGSTVTVDKTWNGFQFNNVTGALPGAYSIAVSFKPTGYANFGNATTCSNITLGTGIPTTAIASAQCGTTIASTNTTVNCTWVGPGTYRFEVSGGSLGSNTVTVDKTWNGFQFNNVTGALPGTYSVAVSFKPAGQAEFGDATSCSNITLGTGVPTTAISTAQCGTTIASTNAIVNCTWVGPGTYRFVVSGGTLSSAVIVDKTWNGFQFNNVTGALPGTYNVAVSFKPNGQSQFGAASTCNSITLGSSVPTTGIFSTQCGNTIPNVNTVVNCTWVGPGTYRFVVSGGTLSGSVTLDKTWNGFQFSNITNAGPGAYTVSVYFKPTGYASFGDPTSCELIELSSSQAINSQDPQLHEDQTEGLGVEESSYVNGIEENQFQNTTWTATATSNPFAHSFQIKLNGAEGISTDVSFTAQLTDMSGKVYSQATLSKEQLEAESFGEQLAPGMYLITLRQGEELRVLRVVKR